MNLADLWQTLWNRDLGERVERQLFVVQWLLPISLSAIVFVYETFEHIAQKREHIFSYNLIGEVGFFGIAGPTAVFLVLLWIRREWRARTLAQRKLDTLHQERGELVQKLIAAQEDERQRVAREIHDELGQLLTRLSINLKMCEAKIPPHLTEASRSLTETQTLVWQTLEQAHRLIVQLRPTLLDELGLEAALQEELAQRLAPLGVKTALKMNGALDRLPPAVETAAFRIAQEAITNIARHARAQHANLMLARDDGTLHVEIEDDGIGLPADWHTRADRSAHRPLGLLGMQERAAILNGTLTIEPRAPRGTRVTLRVPLNPGAEKSR